MVKKIKSRSVIGTAALALPLAAAAQYSPTPAAAPMGASNNPYGTATVSGAGLINDWLREQSPDFKPWDIGGAFRARMEVKDYFFTPGATPIVPGRPQLDFLKNGGDSNDTYLLTRTRLHVGYNQDWFHIYGESQVSTSTGDKRNPTVEAEEFNLRQGYVMVGNPKEFPLVAKVGRQELVYGDERLIGMADWNNQGITFDAAKLRYDSPDFWVDTFAAHVVVPRDNDFNYSDNYDNFFGIYGSTDKLIPWQQSQLYFLSRNVSHNAPNYATGTLLYPLPSPRDIYNVGMRFKSLPGQLNGFDYDIEADYQFGRVASVTGSAPNAVVDPSLDHRAYAAHADAGYTFTNAFGSPRIDLEGNYASGTSGTSRNGTFDTLYPSDHLFAGIMDFYCWQNIQDARINFTMKPFHKMTFFTSYRGVWLASTSDSFYLPNKAPRTGGTPGAHNGYAINPTYSNFVGTEADVVLTYAFTPWANVGAGYGHFFIGNYIKQSLSAFGSTDADYVYLQTRLSF